MTTRLVSRELSAKRCSCCGHITGRIAAEERQNVMGNHRKSNEILTKIVCLLAYMLAEPFLYCLGYDILLRPGSAPFDLPFDCRTRQVLNKSLW